MPNPFTSIKDLLPANRLETLTEVAIYPSCWSKFHFAAVKMEGGKITQDFKEEMQFYNNAYG